MAKNDLNRISGTPWHIGYVTKKEDDPRRDKRVCAYYNEGHCNFRCGKCIGSSHCPHYKRHETQSAASVKKEKQKLPLKKKKQRLSPPIPKRPGVIWYEDKVTIHCLQTHANTSFTIPRWGSCDKLPKLCQLCLEKRRGDQIVYGEYTYRIIDFVKMRNR